LGSDASSAEILAAAERASAYFAVIVSSALESAGVEQISFSCRDRALAQSKLAAKAEWEKAAIRNMAAATVGIFRNSMPDYGSACDALSNVKNASM